MAGKPLNRLELRRQSEAAEPLDPMEDESDDVVEADDDDEVVARPKRKAKATAKTKAKSTRAAKPAARMKVVWVVMNDAYKPVGTFEYNQKEAADARAAELTAKKGTTHFVQRVKEEIPADAPGIGASIPRSEVTPARAKAVAKASKPPVPSPLDDVGDDDDEEDEEDEVEVEDDSSDDDE